MKLSIIIVSYNEANYIRDAIDSCINQKGDIPMEIIIGDDGSSDGSIDIIREYKDKYPDVIKYFIMDRKDAVNVIPSIRVSNIIKKAFSIATGDYFMTLSSDDILIDEYKISEQISFLEQNKQYMSCYTNFEKIWDNGNKVEVKMKSNIARASFWSSKYMHISCFIFRKEVLNFLLDNFCDDTGLIFSILISGKTMHINRMSFGYRQRDLSIMHEADKLELLILEVLLFNDVIKKGVFINSSYSRFILPIKYLLKNRKNLELEKYKKYIEFSYRYENNILERIVNYDELDKKEKSRIKRFIKKASLIRYIFRSSVKFETETKFFIEKLQNKSTKN